MANNWTYFILDNDTGEVKIGQSTNPFERIKGIKGSDPKRNNLELIAIFPDHSLEKEMHGRFQHLRTTGEWFIPDDELNEIIGQPPALPISFDNGLIVEETKDSKDLPVHPMIYIFIGLALFLYAIMRWGMFIAAGVDSFTYTSVLIVSIVTIGGLAIAYEYCGYRIKVVIIKNGHRHESTEVR